MRLITSSRAFPGRTSRPLTRHRANQARGHSLSQQAAGAGVVRLPVDRGELSLELVASKWWRDQV